jgi:hypothetical protein
MKLSDIKPGRLKKANRLIFYGPHGVGKTTLAANMDNPIWIDAEDSSGEVEVARYPFRDEPGGHVPKSYEEILGAIDALTTEEHSFTEVVIDTADRVETLIWDHVCARDSRKGKLLTSVESYGYGKGYVVALDEWRLLCARLDELRTKRDMTIVILGHSGVKTFKNPSGEDYDRYQLRLQEKAAGWLGEWADVIGFCSFEEGASKGENENRAKGWSTGKRLIHFARGAAHDAKSRLSLPDLVEMPDTDPFEPLRAALATSKDPGELVGLINAELARIGDDELTKKVKDAVASAGSDAVRLMRFLNSLRSR